MTYTLTQVQGFVAVAEELHFGRAAERLQMTQPPLSRQIQALERHVGATLLGRHTRGVSLTAAGHQFLADARRILALVAESSVLAQQTAQGRRGTLRIGFTPIGAQAVLGSLLSTLRRTLPDVSVALSELSSTEQLDELSRQSLDVGILRPPLGPGIRSHATIWEDLVLAVPSRHPLALTSGPVDLAQISSDLMGFSPEGALRVHDSCAALVDVADFLRTEITGQVATMLALVRQGHALALIPRSCVAMTGDGLTVRELPAGQVDPVALHVCTAETSWNPAVGPLVEAVARGWA